MKRRVGKSAAKRRNAAEVQPVYTDAAESTLAQIHAAVSGKRGKLADTIWTILAEG